MNKLILSLCLGILFYRQTSAQAPADPITNFLRTNAIGFPVIHKKVSWTFDPNVSLKRRKQFIELHGDKGEKLIERLGLGIDGNYEERLQEQRKRDEGHLGGLNAFLP